MEVKKVEEWILFWDKVFFSRSGNLLKDKINLLPIRWEHIKKSNSDYFIVDYPGEYEKYNVYIQCMTGDTNRLNFFIQDYNAKEYYAFIQDPSILENLDLGNYPSKWYFEDDIVANQLERLGFEGELFKI